MIAFEKINNYIFYNQTLIVNILKQYYIFYKKILGEQ